MAIEAIILAVAIGGSAYSASEQRKGRKEQKKANERTTRIEAVRAQRERAQALRANRLNASQVFAQAGAAGVGGSSAVQGTLASGGTQAAGEFAFAGQIDQLNRQRLGFLDNAEGHIVKAGYGQAVSNAARSYGG